MNVATRISGLALIAVLAAACGGGAGDFCQRLGSADDCDSSAKDQCYAAIEQQNQQTPQCATELDALFECIGELERVGCSGPGSAYANGDGEFEGYNYTDIGDADLVVNDSGCDVLKREYDMCRGVL